MATAIQNKKAGTREPSTASLDNFGVNTLNKRKEWADDFRVPRPLDELPSNGNQTPLTIVKEMTPPPLIRFAPPSIAKPILRKFDIKQQFEGTIVELDAKSFWAQLMDLTDSANDLEFAEFSRAEISKADQAILTVGSVFYWSIGYVTSPAGTITRVSEIRLRRAPRWSKRDIESIHRKAKALMASFDEK